MSTPFNATAPDTSRVSAAYSFISTAEVLARVEALTGWRVARTISQSRGNVEFGKHVVLLERTDNAPGTDRQQIALLNSHDGTTSFRLLLARYVAVCSNGLFMPVGTSADFRVRHAGKNVAENVATAINRIATHLTSVEGQIERMRATPFTRLQETVFAELALKELRGVELAHLNPVMRTGQDGANLWDAFNRIQERAVRGGFMHLVPLTDDKGNPAGTAVRTGRKISAPAELVRVNSALWEKASALIAA
jgi:hypothetical protein